MLQVVYRKFYVLSMYFTFFYKTSAKKSPLVLHPNDRTYIK